MTKHKQIRLPLEQQLYRSTPEIWSRVADSIIDNPLFEIYIELKSKLGDIDV